MLSFLLVINPLIHHGSDDSAYLPLSNPHITDAVIVPRSCCKWNTPRPAGAAKDFVQTAGQHHGELQKRWGGCSGCRSSGFLQSQVEGQG